MVDLDEAGAQQIEAGPFPDWVLVAFGRVWVTGVGKGIGIYDLQTGELTGTVELKEQPSGKETSWTAVDVSPEGESSVGVGEGGVWVVASNGIRCSNCLLVVLDPTSGDVVRRIRIPEGAAAVRVGLGGAWVTYPDEDQVLRVDPDSGERVSTIQVGAGPLFLDVGEGGVWVMDQVDGSVSHIDPKANASTSIPVDPSVILGGDIAVGSGFVWLRATAEIVAQIDPRTDEVVARYGSPLGSGSVDAGGGAVWVSAHDVTSIYRIPL